MIPRNLFKPEKQQLQIGFLPLTDCAILVAAQKQDLFEKYGLQVTLRKETSWASIRDRVAVGELDAAHMLAPMPLAASLGIDGLGVPMETAFSMGLNGSAITLSSGLMKKLRAIAPESFEQSPLKATALKKLIQSEPEKKLKFAHVYPFSQHHYLLRAWLQDADIDPDKDVELSVIPPSLMVDRLATGDIDGYCVGSPWNLAAIQQGIGEVAITSYEIWNNGPDKVLGVTQEWAAAHPQAHQALLAALLEAAQWLDHVHHRIAMAEYLSQPEFINVPPEQITPSLVGRFPFAIDEPERFIPDHHCFFRYAANAPWHSQGDYFVQQIKATGQLNGAGLNPKTEKKLIPEIYRMDTYRMVCEKLGMPHPSQNSKTEGKHDSPWVLHHSNKPIAMGSSRTTLSGLFADQTEN